MLSKAPFVIYILALSPPFVLPIHLKEVDPLQRSRDRLSWAPLVLSFIHGLLSLMLLLLTSAHFVFYSRYDKMYIHGLPSRFNHCVEAIDLLVGMSIPVVPSRRIYWPFAWLLVGMSLLTCFLVTIEVTCLIKYQNHSWALCCGQGIVLC